MNYSYAGKTTNNKFNQEDLHRMQLIQKGHAALRGHTVIWDSHHDQEENTMEAQKNQDFILEIFSI